MKKTLFILALLAGCEDHPRTAQHEPDVAEAIQENYQLKQELAQAQDQIKKYEERQHADFKQYLDCVDAVLDVANQRDTCAELEHSHYKQLQQCRQQLQQCGGKDMGQ